MRATVFVITIFCMLWIHLPTAAQAEGTEEGRARVLATSLNIRKAPDLQSTVIGSLERNTIVTTVSKNSYGWTQIVSGRVTGWVAGYYLEELTAAAASKDEGSKASKNLRKRFL